MKMKRILIALFTVFLVVGFLAMPLVFVSAAHGDGEKGHPGDIEGFSNLPDGPQSGGTILDTIDAITDWIFAIIMLIAVIYLIMGAYQFITGGGDPAKVSEARQKLLYAIIGIALAFAASGIDNVLRNIIG